MLVELVIECAFITALQGLGIFLNVMRNIIGLGSKFPDKKRKEILIEFWDKDWDTLAASVGLWALHIVIHIIMAYYEFVFLITSWEYYLILSYSLALVVGFGGQELAYRWLGKATQYFDNKVNDIK